MFAPFIFLNEETPPMSPCPGPRLFLTRSSRCELPVDSSSLSCKFVLEGEETYIINGRAHRLLAGDFIIVDAGADGSIDIPRRGRTVALSVFLGQSAGGVLMPGHGPVMRPPVNGTLGKLLRRTAATYARNPASLPQDAGPLVRQITTAASALAMDALAKLDKVSLARPGPRHDLLMRLEKARDHLDAALLSPVALA